MKRSAFTLVELLVVIAVIAILVGLMVPLMQGMHKRSLASDARDLCIQVADAWELLTVDYGRFPSTQGSESVIQKEAKKGNGTLLWSNEGDLAFAMTAAMGNVLNFWTPKSPLPQTDKDVFKQNLTKSNVTWNGSGDPDLKEVEKWNPDTRFERSIAQKRFGVFAMGSRADDSDDDRSNDRPEDESCLVVVMIDADGDGIIHLEKGKLRLAGKTVDVPGVEETVRRRAIAWCKVARADDQIVCSWQ